MLTISVKNLGPIAEGTVDLKPLTIFVGPSNTGKSYMAMAVYSVMKAVGLSVAAANRHPTARLYQSLARQLLNFGRKDFDETPQEIIDAFWDWPLALESNESDPSELAVSILPEVAQSDIEQTTGQLLGRLQRAIFEQMRQTYGELSGAYKLHSEPEDFRVTVTIVRNELVLNVEVGESDERFA